MHVSSHHDPVDARTRRPCCLCVSLSLLRAVKELDTVVESCERLFSSPIPPNMARHCMRSLTLWLLALPVVLTQAMPPLLVGLWTAITSYIYLGVDELGAEVEQPFAMMPLWQLVRAHTVSFEPRTLTHPLTYPFDFLEVSLTLLPYSFLDPSFSRVVHGRHSATSPNSTWKSRSRRPICRFA
jgi:hypothetical protein